MPTLGLYPAQDRSPYNIEVGDWGYALRPSQRGDPGDLKEAVWRVDGPALMSTEGPDGYLGVAAYINADGRWEGTLCLGPLINEVTLSTYDRTWTGMSPGEASSKPGTNFKLGSAVAATNADGQAEFGQIGYITRGHQLAKTDLSDMTLKRSRVLPNPATTILRTEAEGGAYPNELSVGMGEQSPYEVLTVSATHPNSDSWAQNSAGQSARVLAQAPDRVVALTGQTVTGNILTGAVTMQAPSWNTVATIRSAGLKFTGFGLDGNIWVVITSDGPYVLDADTAKFFPLMPEIDNNAENGPGSGHWSQIGTVIALRSGATFLKAGSFEGFGVEQFTRNETEIQGYPTAHAAALRWLYQIVYNPNNGHSYLIAWRFRRPGDPTSHLLQPFPIARFPSLQSRYLRYLGTLNGVRSSLTLMGGYGSNAFHMLIGQTAREIDDSSYAYASTGNALLTELRNSPGTVKDLESCEFDLAGGTGDETVTVNVSVDGGTFNALSGTLKYPAIPQRAGANAMKTNALNGVANTTGVQRLLFVDDSREPLRWASGYRIQPRLDLARGSTNTNSPKVLGEFRLYYRERPELVRKFQFAVTLTERRGQTDRSKRERLDALVGKQVRLRLPDTDEQVWTRIDAFDGGTLTATEWSH